MSSSVQSSCFLFERGVGRRIFCFFPCFQCVPIMFPNTFLKMFPTAPWFYSMWFAESSIPMYINWKGGLWVGDYTCFYFAIGVQKGAPIGELPIIPKQLMMGRWIWVFQKNKKIMKAPMNYLIWIIIGMK